MQRSGLAEAPIENRREFGRTLVLMSGTVYSEREVGPCAIFNLSLGGAKLRVSEPLPAGFPVTLTISRSGVFRGEVVWQDDRLAGIRFLDSPRNVARVLGEFLPDGGFSASTV